MFLDELSLIITISAGVANHSQSGDECLDENTEFENPDLVRTFFGQLNTS